MTTPPGQRAQRKTLTDHVREIYPKFRYSMSAQEKRLGISLRGNAELYEALVGLVQSRIGGRAKVPVPNDPLMCKSILERDSELRWFLSKLEYVYRAPAPQPADERGEQPA